VGRLVKIRCESCAMGWDAPTASLTGYAQQELETKPCPVCGACTLSVSHPEPPRRRGPTVRSFIVPKRMAKAA
jgi:hypothetical protein